VTRSGPSRADLAVICKLAGRGISVSPAQLERWRRAGLMPRNSRRGRGRGGGSTSMTHPEAAEIAATISSHARQGRDLRLAVIDWFAAAGLPGPPGQTAIPEPPLTAVKQALGWIITSGPEYQLLQQARASRTEEELDEVFASAEVVLRPITSSPAVDLDAARQAVATGQDVPPLTRRNGQQVRAGFTHLIAATGTGLDEYDPELLAQSAADVGLMPTVDAEHWQQFTARLQNASALPGGYLVRQLITEYDPLEMLNLANHEWLLRAREAARNLKAIGSLLILHMLQLPDTPGLKTLREAAEGWALKTPAMIAALGADRTTSVAHAIIGCLHPVQQAIVQALMALVDSEPWWPATPQAAGQFMADWQAAVDQAQAAAAFRHPSGRQHGARGAG